MNRNMKNVSSRFPLYLLLRYTPQKDTAAIGAIDQDRLI
jgi:hypothetical protein